ncbi:MAG: VOC family protein [Acidimicrobiia bacterium]
MGLRWYTIVIDCRDVAVQAAWWAEALGWKAIYESPDEVVLVPGHYSEELVRTTPVEQVPPGLVFVPVPEGKTVKNRLHIDLAPNLTDDREAEIARLLDMGATRVDVGQSGEVSWDVLADPEGNEFCVLSSRAT